MVKANGLEIESEPALVGYICSENFSRIRFGIVQLYPFCHHPSCIHFVHFRIPLFTFFLRQLVSLFYSSLGQFFATTCLRFFLLTRTVLWNCFILEPLFLYISYSRNTIFLCIVYSYVYLCYLYKFCTYFCIFLLKQHVDASKGIFKPVVLLHV